MVDDGHGQHANQATVVGANNQTLTMLTNNNKLATNKSNSLARFDETFDTFESASNDSSSLARGINQTAMSPLSAIFPASKESVRRPLISQEKFHWDQIEQGHIMGAFFYGYILFQIPGARMAELVGARWIIMAANAGSALISLLFPLSTQLNSIHLLMALRFVMGLCQSAFFPAAYVLFCRWLPEKERSILLPIMFIGSNMGNISTYIMSSYLVSSSYGWPSVFYVSGLICLLVTILWCLFGSNGPDENWFITDEERHYIENNTDQISKRDKTMKCHKMSGLKQNEQVLLKNRLAAITEADAAFCAGVVLGKQELKPTATGNKLSMKKSASYCGDFTTVASDSQQQQQLARQNKRLNGAQVLETAQTNQTGKDSCHRLTVPSNNVGCDFETKHSTGLSWPKLLKSVPVWTLILSMYGNEWSNVVICFELPTYLNTALNFPIEQNGVINSFIQLSYTVASPVMSSLGAYMLDKHVLGMRKIHVRKLFQSLATFGQSVCFISVPICGSNRGLIIMFMFAAIVFKTCANAGDIMVPGDLSPEYAGTIFAFANSIGNTAGFFVPLLAGAIVNDGYVREHWTPFWFITAAIMCSSGLIFLFLGETRLQDLSRNGAVILDGAENGLNECETKRNYGTKQHRQNNKLGQ